MIVEEIPCGGCRLARAAEDIDERSISPVLSNDKLAVAQCLDCDHHYCADCLLEHQIDTAKSSHRLVSLKRSSAEEASVSENAEEEAVDVAEEEAQEINNNDIMFAKKMKYSKPDDLAEGDDEQRRRLSNAGSDKIIREDEDEDDENEEEVNETAPDSSDLNLLNDVNSEEQLLFAAQIAALSKLDPQLQQQQLQQQQQQQKALFSARSIEALRQFIEMKQLQQQQEQQQAVAATNASASSSVANNR